MPESSRLERDFFDRDTVLVARELLGSRLVRLEGGLRLSGTIVEAEAYRGQEDLGSHARVGKTARTQVMYGPPGHAYVYFTYGNHWMLNFVTERDGFPGAVLVRAILPHEGVDIIASRRGRQPRERWTDGPGKLCQALAITGALNGIDICSPDSPLFVEWGSSIPETSVTRGPRVGLYSVPEPWKSIPWRFLAVDGTETPGKRRTSGAK
jgi:DNA-3-methyladenine glycosylase